MRFAAVPVILLCTVVSAALSQQYRWEFVRSHAVVGKAPLWLAFGPREGDPRQQSTAYVLCAGVDANFNGQPDPGDQPPSLTLAWEENGSEVAINRAFLWGTLSFPLRPVFRTESGQVELLLPTANRLLRFRFPPLNLEQEDTLLPEPVQAVTLIGDTIVASQRIPGGADIGRIVKIVPGIGVVDTLRLFSCPNIQQLVWDSARRQLIVLCEGVFGSGNSQLHFLPEARDSGTVVTPIGDTGNFLLLSGDTLVVVLNGSHEVMLIDPATHLQYRMPISTGTSGYGGPREAVLLTLPNGQRTLLVSTYSRDIRWIDLATGQLLQLLPLTGLAEGMALRRLGDTLELWVAQPFTPSYGPDSTVAIFRLVLLTHVGEETTAMGQPRLIPQLVTEGPARLEWELPGYAGRSVQAEVYTVEGRRWYAWELPVGSSGRVSALLPLSRALLPAGWYTLSLTAGSQRVALPFVVY